MREFLVNNQVELLVTGIGLVLCWLAILLLMLIG